MICLLPNCGYLSEVTRMLEILRALRERGVASSVATHGGRYEDVLRSADVSYDILGPGMSVERSDAFVKAAVGQGSIRQSMYSDDELRTYAQAEADHFQAHQIRVAVTGFTLTTLLSTRLAGIPLVTEHAGCWVPPVFERGMVPAPSKPIHPAARLLPRRLDRWLTNQAAQRVPFYTSGFNRVAAELGVEPVPSLSALLMGDLALVPEHPDVLGIGSDEVAAWRPRRRAYRTSTRLCYVGPIYARLDIPLPPHVAEFLDRPGPLIYVAITSSPPRLVRDVVRSLAPLDARVLVAAPAHELTDLVTGRVMVAGFLPSHLAMPRAALAITAGGQGSVQTAMAAGTPLIGIPLQPEQDLNVVLAERFGAARRVGPDAVLLGRLADVAREMLADDTYRRAAARVQQLYQAIDGPGNAADAIIDLALRGEVRQRRADYSRRSSGGAEE